MIYIQVQLIHVQLIGIIQILILQFGLIIQKAQKAYKAEKEKTDELYVQAGFYKREQQERARYVMKILENIFGTAILNFGIK